MTPILSHSDVFNSDLQSALQRLEMCADAFGEDNPIGLMSADAANLLMDFCEASERASIAYARRGAKLTEAIEQAETAETKEKAALTQLAEIQKQNDSLKEEIAFLRSKIKVTPKGSTLEDFTEFARNYSHSQLVAIFWQARKDVEYWRSRYNHIRRYAQLPPDFTDIPLPD